MAIHWLQMPRHHSAKETLEKDGHFSALMFSCWNWLIGWFWSSRLAIFESDRWMASRWFFFVGEYPQWPAQMAREHLLLGNYEVGASGWEHNQKGSLRVSPSPLNWCGKEWTFLTLCCFQILYNIYNVFFAGNLEWTRFLAGCAVDAKLWSYDLPCKVRSQFWWLNYPMFSS